MKRRQLLASGGIALATGIAGCSASGSGGDGGSNNGNNTNPSNSSNANATSGSAEQSIAGTAITEWPPAEYEDSINVWNWYTQWRDVAVERFVKEYDGIEDYTVDSYNNPGQFYAQIQQSHSIDSIGSTGEYTQRMMANDLAEPLPVEMMPAWEMVKDEYKQVTMDTYSTDGDVFALPNVIVVMPVIAYNQDYFDSPPDSFDIFWEEDLAGQILMWDRDYLLMQIAALYTGQDPHDPDDWNELREVLVQQRDLNQTYYQNHDTAMQLLANEDVVVAATPTNSILQAKDTMNDSLSYTVPKEGTLYSIDQQVVPKGAPNPVAGAMFADYSLSAESAKIFWNEAYVITSHVDAFDIIAEVEDNSDLVELARYNNDWDLSERRPLSEEVRQKTSDLYTEVLGA
ncbi:PotD/PotF family extracellular solute-binding protein [Halococcus sp. IIIV-5B]|uniref:ABC transporter substrate-binding protein n=1 Tax=Halococcus sp. IIIV-5B TaxID=2321230 RepID=UPI001314CA20|nr:PotD/PotF family extracellular solute-binding protein [Halococcus sp. IIIV-5B]